MTAAGTMPRTTRPGPPSRPKLTEYRRQIGGLFSAAAESTRLAAQACAAALVTRLADGGRKADVAAEDDNPHRRRHDRPSARCR